MSEVSSQPTPTWMLWLGRILSALAIVGMAMSATMKFLQPQELVEEFEKFGYPLGLAAPLGIVQIVCTVLYLIPQTAVLGAILLTGYFGGAISTHIRIGDTDWAAPVIISTLLWLGLYFRDARVRAVAPLRL